jgi:hypothetical protein
MPHLKFLVQGTTCGAGNNREAAEEARQHTGGARQRRRAMTVSGVRQQNCVPATSIAEQLQAPQLRSCVAATAELRPQARCWGPQPLHHACSIDSWVANPPNSSLAGARAAAAAHKPCTGTAETRRQRAGRVGRPRGRRTARCSSQSRQGGLRAALAAGAGTSRPGVLCRHCAARVGAVGALGCEQGALLMRPNRVSLTRACRGVRVMRGWGCQARAGMAAGHMAMMWGAKQVARHRMTLTQLLL